jgi:hypothetical protein
MLTRKTKKPQSKVCSTACQIPPMTRSSNSFSRVQTSDSDVRFFHFAGYFDVNKMFINAIWKLYNVNSTRRICVTSVSVETIKTARTECEF